MSKVMHVDQRDSLILHGFKEDKTATDNPILQSLLI